MAGKNGNGLDQKNEEEMEKSRDRLFKSLDLAQLEALELQLLLLEFQENL